MATRARPLRPWPFGPRGDAGPPVRPLDPADVAGLRLPWTSRFASSTLAAHLTRWPGYGWIAPPGEYLIVEPWRRRDEIAAVLEIQARRSRGALLARAAADLQAAGVRLLLLPEGEGPAHHRDDAALGFVRLEEIIYYQLAGLAGPPATARPLPPLDLAPVTEANLTTALAVDHAAFPWLWWNSAVDLRAYHGSPGVQIWLAWTAGVPVAYAGFTTLDRWSHLDRLAVDPAWQGRGYGAALLAFALGRMAAQGVSRVTLSTQAANVQSQRLYRGFGFRQTTETYAIYGAWLGEPVVSGQ